MADVTASRDVSTRPASSDAPMHLVRQVRRTKIICTIGPATASYPQLEALALAGMNVARLNMSHADHAGALQIINWIKTLNRKLVYPVAILLDTKGPEIRTGEVGEPMDLIVREVGTDLSGDDVMATMDAAPFVGGVSATPWVIAATGGILEGNSLELEFTARLLEVDPQELRSGWMRI